MRPVPAGGRRQTPCSEGLARDTEGAPHWSPDRRSVRALHRIERRLGTGGMAHGYRVRPDGGGPKSTYLNGRSGSSRGQIMSSESPSYSSPPFIT